MTATVNLRRGGTEVTRPIPDPYIPTRMPTYGRGSEEFCGRIAYTAEAHRIAHEIRGLGGLDIIAEVETGEGFRWKKS